MFSKDADEVNDLFQEILVNLWKGLQSYEGDKFISTWVWRVSLNTCINYSKQQKRALEKVPHFPSGKKLTAFMEKIGLGEDERNVIGTLLWASGWAFQESAATTLARVEAV